MIGKCELCKRENVKLTNHHLIPKQKGGKSEFKNYVKICIPCGKQIHGLFTGRELKREFNTIEKLKSSNKVQKWIEWVRKKNPEDITYHGIGGFHK